MSFLNNCHFGNFWKNGIFWQFSSKKWQFSGNILEKNGNFLSIFGHSIGNFPEGKLKSPVQMRELIIRYLPPWLAHTRDVSGVRHNYLLTHNHSLTRIFSYGRAFLDDTFSPWRRSWQKLPRLVWVEVLWNTMAVFWFCQIFLWLSFVNTEVLN